MLDGLCQKMAQVSPRRLPTSGACCFERLCAFGGAAASRRAAAWWSEEEAAVRQPGVGAEAFSS